MTEPVFSNYEEYKALSKVQKLIANKWEIVLLRGNGKSWEYLGRKFQCSGSTVRRTWPMIRRICRKEVLKGNWPHMPGALR